MNRPAPHVATTERLLLTDATVHDAPFILALLNEPRWLRFIGDRGVRTLDDATHYLAQSILPSYAAYGFGLWVVRQKHDLTPLGLCGLIKRDPLAEVEIGFAFLEAHSGRGYATEAVAATLRFGWEKIEPPRIIAITDPANTASIHILQKMGLTFEAHVPLPSGGQQGNRYAMIAPASANA
jgi:ribosomal-protein-alanine N-acetyltransferase